MKNSSRLLLGFFALASLFSCSEDLLETPHHEYLNNITVTVEDINQDEASSRALSIEDGQMKFAWTLGDVIGIYPLKDAVTGASMGEDQHAFPISNGAGSATAYFDGGAWALRSNIIYAAYYPFSASNYQVSPSQIPVSYLGQAQDGNASTSHLSPYDYLVASATQPNANGGVDLQLLRKGCIARLELTMPVADTYTKVTVASSKTPFVIKGTIDLTAVSPAIQATETSQTVTINLTNIATTSNEQKLNIYFMSCPADLSDSELTITVFGTTNQTYVATAAGKALTANSRKRFSARCNSGTNAKGEPITFGEVMDGDTHTYVDLGLSVKWATMNVGATEVSGSKTNAHTGKLDCYGEYYAWGETTPKDTYSVSTYIFYNGSLFSITKYNTDLDHGTVDNKTTLELSDDAAHVNWGEPWRMPTKAEQDELLDNCYWEWTTSYNSSGVAGYIVYKAKNDSDKGKKKNESSSSQTPTASYSLSDTHIFLPASGCRYDNSIGSVGSYGGYWSSSLYTYASDLAYNWEFTSSYDVWSSMHRDWGSKCACGLPRRLHLCYKHYTQSNCYECGSWKQQ